MTTLSLDWETRSEAQLVGPNSVGLDNYVKHPSTRTLLLAYSWGDNQSDIGLVDFSRGETIPPEVRDGMTDPYVQKWAFNAQFEITVARVLHEIDMTPEACRCTMALAHMRSFSGSLGQIGEQIGLPGYDTKDAQGKRLIKLFCEPQKITKANKHVWRDETTDTEDWALFRDYCRQDVKSEIAMKRWLTAQGRVADWEWRLWEIDQHINARGLPVDIDFVRNAYEMFETRKWELREALENITGMTSLAENVGSRAQLLAWLQRNGYPWADLQKNTIMRALEEHKSGERPLNEAVVAALRVRQQLGRTAPTKYAAIMRRASADRRLRYCFQFGGAARTTRWSGRGPQPQNLVRPPKEYDNIQVMNTVAGVIAEGDYTGLQLWAGEPMNALAGLVRCAFMAGEAKQLCVSDIKSVESVGVGFVSRCERMLDVFRKGRDAYIDFAKDVYGIPYEAVTPEQRKIIKPAVLGCGYGLAGGYVLPDGKKTGLLGYAAGMGVMLTPEVAQTHVELWRATYPEVPQTWYDIEKAMHQTIEDRRGRTVNGLLTFRIEGQFLTMELPTERKIWYYKPRVEQRQYISKRTGNPYTQKVMTCMGMVKDKHYWSRIEMRGNLVFENAIQGMCRDIHGNGMILAHDKGFLLVGMVHDELISEEDIGSNYYTSERLRDCVRAETRFPRLKGMPLDASHFSTIRYRKD